MKEKKVKRMMVLKTLTKQKSQINLKSKLLSKATKRMRKITKKIRKMMMISKTLTKQKL